MMLRYYSEQDMRGIGIEDELIRAGIELNPGPKVFCIFCDDEYEGYESNYLCPRCAPERHQYKVSVKGDMCYVVDTALHRGVRCIHCFRVVFKSRMNSELFLLLSKYANCQSCSFLFASSELLDCPADRRGELVSALDEIRHFPLQKLDHFSTYRSSPYCKIVNRFKLKKEVKLRVESIIPFILNTRPEICQQHKEVWIRNNYYTLKISSNSFRMVLPVNNELVEWELQVIPTPIVEYIRHLVRAQYESHYFDVLVIVSQILTPQENLTGVIQELEREIQSIRNHPVDNNNNGGQPQMAPQQGGELALAPFCNIPPERQD